MAFINMMEKMVDIRIDERYKVDKDHCECEQCREDIKCIALNNLPPKYVSTSKGELFSKIDQQMVRQNVLDIDMAVISAMEFVKKNPRH